MKLALKFFCLALLLIGLPLAGLLLHGMKIAPYLAFPPPGGYVVHAPFSRTAFAGLSLFLVLVLAPFVLHAFKTKAGRRGASPVSFPFPWWGWLGLILSGVSWLMAWSRFTWFAPLQPHTFTPLWISYILIVNALTYRRQGRCPLVDQTSRYLLLFLLSAVFWWFFEFLNRFVRNWYYVGVKFGPWGYFIFATLPFSTVLPAVVGTRELLLTFDWPDQRFSRFFAYRFPRPKLLALAVLALSSAGLFYIGLYPDYLFPLVWVSPLLIFVSLQELLNETHIFLPIRRGHWTLIVASSLAALICGFFWEMWNFYSLARWQYAIPFVDCCKIFEMPLLGYAGYLPFGLECSVVAGLFMKDYIFPCPSCHDG